MSGRIFHAMIKTIERGGWPRTRKIAWKTLYQFLPWIFPDRDWRFMNYGFVPEGQAPLELRPEDEPDRAFIGLYELAVTGIDTQGKTILEVGSGRGGGARYLARYHKPSEVTGLDFSTSAVRFANQHSRDWPNLKFVKGDAAALPFPNDSFDIVVNIESSHCYPDVAAFAGEVSRVLKPEGIFSFADMRSPEMTSALDRDLAAENLVMVANLDISAGVLRGLDLAEERKIQRLKSVKVIRQFMTEFAGMRESALYRALQHGRVVYIARRYKKIMAQ